MRDIIYMDNAATTWPKAPGVAVAMSRFIEESAANPGRGGHSMSLEAGRVVFECRRKVADLLRVKNAARIVFTGNATQALNMAICGVLKAGDHCVTTSMEHNAVLRPLHALSSRGVEVTIIECASDGTLDVGDVLRAMKSNTRLVALTHASNVCGTIMPIEEVARITRERQVLLLVDAAQTAGVYPLSLEHSGIDLLAAPGHKSLLGPTGTGILYVREGLNVEPVLFGGTGSFSELLDMPLIFPDRLESGTLNTVGLAGLSASLDYLLEAGIDHVRQHEDKLARRLREGLSDIAGVTLYGDGRGAPIVSFNIDDLGSTEVAYMLDASFSIATRAGLHCAPLAHKTLGTLHQGVVRLSPGAFSTQEEVDKVIAAVQEIARER